MPVVEFLFVGRKIRKFAEFPVRIEVFPTYCALLSLFCGSGSRTGPRVMLFANNPKIVEHLEYPLRDHPRLILCRMELLNSMEAQ